MKVAFTLGNTRLFDQSDMDEYAIKFATWISKGEHKFHPKPDYDGTWYNDIVNNDYPKYLTSAELFEIFKEQTA